LEGIAGEDHMKTNSDVPFGEFQINQSTPFINPIKRIENHMAPIRDLFLSLSPEIKMKPQKVEDLP
jgi:hypothetical protein